MFEEKGYIRKDKVRYRIVNPPKRSSDWINHLVFAKHSVKNGLGEMSAYTVYRITHSTTQRTLESLGCKCCTFKFSFTTSLRKKEFCEKYTFLKVTEGEVVA